MAEMEQFELLLNHGLDTKTMIELSFKNSELIINRLNQGEPLIQAICKDMKSSSFKNIMYFSKFLSLKDAFICSKKLKNNSFDLFIEFFKLSFYSIFIIFFCFFLILFFSNSILPSMLMYSNDDYLFYILSVIKFFYYGLFGFIFLFIFICIFIYLNRPIYSSFLKICPFSFIKIYITLQFSYIFHVLIQQGLSTNIAIQYISNMDSSFESKCIALDLLNKLKQGYSFDKAIRYCSFLDSQYLHFIELGKESGNMSLLLDLYEEKMNLYLHTTIKKYVNMFQIFSYISVGILCVLVYQIMLLPLNMLGGF